MIFSEREQHLFEIEHIINVFTVTFDAFNASWLIFLKKCPVYFMIAQSCIINLAFLLQNQPLKSLRKLLHLSSPATSNQPPPPDRSAELRFQPLPNPPSKGNLNEARGLPPGSLTPNTKSRKPHNYPLPGQIESSWHVSALNRAEGAPYPDQMANKGGQNGIGFTRATRVRMPNLNDLKETAL